MSNANVFCIVASEELKEKLHKSLDDKLIEGFRDKEFGKIHFKGEPVVEDKSGACDARQFGTARLNRNK